MSEKKKKISVVIALYNEAGVVDELFERLMKAADSCAHAFEFIFVNDGSTDETLAKLDSLCRKDERVLALDLARNFGHHAALTAGIEEAVGDAIVLMDADLEDNPEDLEKFIAAWDEGNEVVYAVRGRRDVGLIRSAAFNLYHTINSRLEQRMPIAGTFSLIDRRVIDVLKKMPERTRYIPGLRSWAGFRQKGITLDRGTRYDHRPRVSFLRLIRLALDSYVAFSKLPLKLASMFGVFFSIIGFCATIVIVGYQLTTGFRIIGWASLMSTIIFASGIQLICLGILGEYMAQILDETKGRPVYILRAKYRGDRRTDV